MTRSLTAILLATLAAWGAGCKQPVLCPALGACGGPAPISLDQHSDQEWVLAPGSETCTEDLYVPPADTRLAMGNLPNPGTPYPEPAVFDWCDLLVTGPGAGGQVEVKPPRFYYESGPIGFATLKFGADGHFSTGISRTGTFVIYFPAYCIHAFGAMNGRPADPTDPTSQPTDVCQQLEAPIKASGTGEGSYQNTTCRPNNDQYRAMFETAVGVSLDVPADPNGCLCVFDVDETGGPAGTWSLYDSNTIIDFPDAVASNFPQKTTFCAQGDNLQLTGADGAYLFDQKGLRTMSLVRACSVNGDCASNNCVLNATTGRGVCR